MAKLFNSHDTDYKFREWINSREYDSVLGTVQVIVKEGKINQNGDFTEELAKISTEKPELIQLLVKTQDNLIKSLSIDPKIEDVGDLDAAFVADLRLWAMGLVNVKVQEVQNKAQETSKKA